MAEVNPPWALENAGATHHANVLRMLFASLAGKGEGASQATDLVVAQRGAGANMSVDVAAGSGSIFGDANLTQGMYGVVNDAVTNKAITAADPTNPRRDLVGFLINDAFYSGATNNSALTVVTGVAAPSPVDPAVPNNFVTLARVAVAAAAGSIITANITDLRPFTELGLFPVNSARRPGVLYGPFSQEPAFKPVPQAGQLIYEVDNNLLLVWNGTAWCTITPKGNTITTAESTASGAYVDLATVGPAVTLQTGVKVLVTIDALAFSNAGGNSQFMAVAVSGATTLAAADVNGMLFAGSVAASAWQSARSFIIAGLTAGINVFTAKYRTNGAGTSTFQQRDITVVALPN